MSATILVNLACKSNLYRNLKNLSCVLTSGTHYTYGRNRSQFVVEKFSKYLAPSAGCTFSTRSEGKPDITKNVISEVKIKENEPCSPEIANETTKVKEKKLGLFARFKLMYKQYWYVLIPVHVVTSIGWFGGFYYLSKSGVDVPSILQTLYISEGIIEKVKGSDMGHIAIAYLLYKIATPVRYAVTLGGTTFFINYLCQFGYIKPMPSKDELIKMYEDKKAGIVKRKQEIFQEKKFEKE